MQKDGTAEFIKYDNVIKKGRKAVNCRFKKLIKKILSPIRDSQSVIAGSSASFILAQCINPY